MAALRASMRRHPLIWFFALAFGINVAATSTTLVEPIRSWSPAWLIAIASPSIAAYLISAGIGGREEVRRLAAGYSRWRIGWRWYLAATSLALIPLAIAVVYIAFGNPPRGLEPGMALGTYLLIAMGGWVTGPLAEESGWRGFALPRMQARWSALNASLLLGLLWALWHIPQYLTGGVQSGGMMPFPIFVPVTIVLSVLFAWVFNNTRGSLVATTVMHFSYNFSGGHIGGLLGLVPATVLYIAGGGLVVLAVVVVARFGPRHLSRRPVAEIPIAPPSATGTGWSPPGSGETAPTTAAPIAGRPAA
jgi:membrane protease YdiL (CAAX protease family)